MHIEEKISQLLLNQEKAIRVARSYYQYQDTYGLPPEDLSKEFETYRKTSAFCDFCTPSLIIIPSIACYEANREFWPNYFKVEHNVRGILSMAYPFEGVRGAYFPFQFREEGQHLDIVEMDDPRYFNTLNDKEKTHFMEQFFAALQKNKRSSHIGLSSNSCDRTHVTFCKEAYVVFASRNHPDYNLEADKIIAMDIPYYRIYQRGYSAIKSSPMR